MQVQKGTVQSVNGSTATCVSAEHPDIVTRPLVIPFYWREAMGNIRPGEQVYYLEDDSHSGMILARCDGEWDFTMRHTLTVEQDVTLNANLTTQGNAAVQGDITTDGALTAAGEVTSGAITLTAHTHTSSAPGAPTSPPIQ